MNPRVAGRGVAVALLALVACGCGVKVYEPGVYKGAKDPLVAKQATPEQEARLRERFTMGQAPR